MIYQELLRVRASKTNIEWINVYLFLIHWQEQSAHFSLEWNKTDTYYDSSETLSLFVVFKNQ